jgi:phosphoacetylglucosamine mutase
MLESSWEGHATKLANAASTDALVDALQSFIKEVGIDMSVPAKVVYARDTRPSGPVLIAALEDGFKAIDVDARNAGVTTTPVLHYLVRSINTKGTKEAYGEDTEEGYYRKLSDAYKKLVVSFACVLGFSTAHTLNSTAFPRARPCSSTVRTVLARRLQKSSLRI